MIEVEEVTFPTGKQHVSFSEIKTWKECPWRHKLAYVDKLRSNDISPHLDFGTILHDFCENFLKTGTIEGVSLEDKLTAAWEEKGFDTPEQIKKTTDRATKQGWRYTHEYLPTWLGWAENIVKALPMFMDETFPGWEYVAAEELLMEPIEGSDIKFKGYIDAIIKVPKKRGTGFTYWIIDWKTAKKYGWRADKKRDFNMQAQLILYKRHWAAKHDIPLKDIRCGFVLLKKGAAPEKGGELVKISAGDKTLAKADKLESNMINMVKKKFYLKNRHSCMFCDFKDTEHCK
jgi:hypothetical protein